MLLLFLDPIAWALWLVAFVFKIIFLGISIFLFLNVLVWFKYGLLSFKVPELDVKDLKEEEEEKTNTKSKTPEDLESELNGKLYGKKLGSSFNFTMCLVAVDYLISWFVTSNGDGLIFGWNEHWCVLFAPLFQFLWSYSAASTLVWLCWVVMVHFVFAAVLHLVLRSIEWSASSPLEWMYGLIVGLYRKCWSFEHSVWFKIWWKEAKEHATILNIEGDMHTATTDEETVTKAYKKAALKWHPDRARVWAAQGITPEKASERFRECKKARDCLVDEFVRTRARAEYFVSRICPLIFAVTIADKYMIRFIWGGDSWWPLAWLFWTLISHFILCVILWFIIPFLFSCVGKRNVKRSGMMFIGCVVAVVLCSVTDVMIGTEFLWRRSYASAGQAGAAAGTGAGTATTTATTTTAWFLYWEILWLFGAAITHAFAFSLLLLFAPGSELEAMNVLQEKQKKEKTRTDEDVEENKETRESRHFAELLWIYFSHRHTLMKAMFLLIVSSFDYTMFGCGLFWNGARYSWPWNFVLCTILGAVGMLRVLAVLLALFHFCGTTGPIRKTSALSVIPLLSLLFVLLLTFDEQMREDVSDDIQGLNRLNVEDVAQSMFLEAGTFAHHVMDDDDDDDNTYGEERGKGGALYRSGGIVDDDGENSKMLLSGQFNGGEFDGDAADDDEFEDPGKSREGRRAAAATLENITAPSDDEQCTWIAWCLSHVVRLIVPLVYTFYSQQRKEVKKNLNTLSTVQGATLRWTTLTCGIAVWFGTSDACFAQTKHVDFATCLLFLGLHYNAPNFAIFQWLQSRPAELALWFLTVLYFPYDQWNDRSMVRMYICLLVPCCFVLCGIALQFVVSAEWVDAWFKRDEFWGKFRETVAGDTASDEFQIWFEKLIEGMGSDSEKKDECPTG